MKCRNKIIGIILLCSAAASMQSAIIKHVSVGDSFSVEKPTQVLVQNNHLIKQKIEGSRIKFQAVKPGKTFITLWYGPDMKQYQITITRKEIVYTKPSQKKSWQGTYAFLLKSDSTSPYPVTETNHNHRLTLSGMTGWGKTNIEMQVSQRGEESGLELLTVILEKRRYRILLGDITFITNSIILPYVTYQGIEFDYQLARDFTVSLLAGGRGHPWYGDSVRADRAEEENIIGLQAIKNFKQRAQIGATYVQGEEREAASIRGFANVSKKATVEAEAAGSNEKSAYKVSGKIGESDRYVRLTYKKIDREIDSVSDFILHQGTDGVFINGVYRIVNGMFLSGYANMFTKTYVDNGSEEESDQKNLQVRYTWNIPKIINIRAIAHQYEGINHTYQNTRLRFTKRKILQSPLTIYYEYNPRIANNEVNDNFGYTETRHSAGIRSNRLFSIIYLYVQNDISHMVFQTDDEKNIRNTSLGIQSGNIDVVNINDRPIQLSCGIKVQNTEDDEATINTTRNGANCRLSYYVLRNFRLYGGINYINRTYNTNQSMPHRFENEVEQNEAYVGGNVNI
ncbi:hypothetical protein ACFL56_03295 [Candidatus Margulisiibacteriota bacterium]